MKQQEVARGGLEKKIQGIGEDLAAKTPKIFSTGRMRFREDLNWT